MNYQQTLPVGSVLDGIYEVQELLGTGGFGKTYLVHDRQLNRQVAVKEFFPIESATRVGLQVHPIAETKKAIFDAGLNRFSREARHLATFAHPNIVKIFRAFDANGTSYIVLEYIDGVDLDDWLVALGRVPTQAELDRLVLPLLSALSRVHSGNILHRDIQPKNIRIRSRDGTPVLLDFGLAKSSLGQESTGTSTVIVAHGYAPAESYASESRRQGAWTDIYGLSAVLYRALAGAAPPMAPDRIYEDPIVPASELPLDAGYREKFLTAIDWALAVDPKKRPQTVSDWKAALTEGGNLTTTGKSSGRRPTTRPTKPTKRVTADTIIDPTEKLNRREEGRRIPYGAILGLLLIIAGGATVGAFYLKLLPGAEKSPQAVENDERKRVIEADRLQQLAKEDEERKRVAEAQRLQKEAKDAEERKQLAQADRKAKEAREEEERTRIAEVNRKLKETKDEEERKQLAEAERQRKEAREAEERRIAADAERRQQELKDEQDRKRIAEAKAEAERQAKENEAREAERKRIAIEERKRSLQWQTLIKPGDSGPVTAFALSPDGNRMATGSQSGTVQLWSLLDPYSAAERYPFQHKLNGQVARLAIDSDNSDRVIASTGQKKKAITLIDFKTKLYKDIKPEGSNQWVQALWSSGQQFLGLAVVEGAASERYGQLERWSFDGKPAGSPSKIDTHKRGLMASAFSLDEDNFALAPQSDDAKGEIRILRAKDGSDIGQVARDRTTPLAIAFSSDKERVAVAGQMGHIEIWNYKAGSRDQAPIKLTPNWQNGESGRWFTALAFSPDGRYLAAGDSQGQVHYWDTTENASSAVEIAGVPKRENGVRWIAFLKQKTGELPVLLLPWDDGSIRRIAIGAKP